MKRTAAAWLIVGIMAAACGGEGTADRESSSTTITATTSTTTTTSSTTTTTSPTTTTTTLASVPDDLLERVVAFVDAHNAGDVDAFVAMHAPGAVVRERDQAGMGSLPEESWTAEYVWKAGVDYRFELGPCWFEDPVVRCSVVVSDVLLDAAGMTWNRHSIRLEWDEAGLVTFFETTGHLYWAEVVESPIRTFWTWARETHPEEAAVMFTSRNRIRFTVEGAALWQQLTPEFAEYLGTS